MPKGQAEAELSGGTRERWQMADRVRHACKRLPHQERIAYLNRLRQEALPVGEPWQRELYSFLSWEEVRELDRRGFSIGSHTATHPILTTLLPSDLVVELRESKSSIEYELKKPCSWLAYPNGQQTDFSPEVMAAAQQAGYKMAFSLSGRTNPEKLSPFAIDRVNVSGKLSADGFHAHLNGLKTWLA
jgi:peptidoglycan/xylan/chitin deacetylase (PgdA/CDA1 family)